MINYLSILFLLLILIRFLVNFSFLEILLISECAPSSTCIRETNKIFKGNVKYLKNFFENYHNINLNKIKDNEFAQYIYVLERNNSNFSYKFKDLYSFVLPPMDEKPFNNVFGQNHGSPGDIVNLKKQRNNSFIIDSFSEFKTNENKIPLISYEMIEHYLLRYYNRELIFDMRFEKYAEKMISLNEKFVERIERYKYINLLSSEEKKDLLNRLTTETKKLDFNFERQSMLRILKDPRLISYPTIKPVFISADKYGLFDKKFDVYNNDYCKKCINIIREGIEKNSEVSESYIYDLSIDYIKKENLTSTGELQRLSKKSFIDLKRRGLDRMTYENS